jgi:DNA-binding GntR family transcriptional regulator
MALREPSRTATSACGFAGLRYLNRMSEVAHILNAIEAGDAQVAEQLLPLVYDEFRKLAVAKLVH